MGIPAQGLSSGVYAAGARPSSSPVDQRPCGSAAARSADRCRRGLGSNADHLTRSHPSDSAQGSGHQRTNIFESGTPRNEDNYTEASPSKVLLKLEILIGRDEGVEPALRRALKQLTVRETRPALLLHGTDLMRRQVAGQVTRQLLIEQDAPRGSPPREPPRGRRLLARAKPMGTRRGTHRGCGPARGSRSDSGTAPGSRRIRAYRQGYQDRYEWPGDVGSCSYSDTDSTSGSRCCLNVDRTDAG